MTGGKSKAALSAQHDTLLHLCCVLAGEVVGPPFLKAKLQKMLKSLLS